MVGHFSAETKQVVDDAGGGPFDGEGMRPLGNQADGFFGEFSGVDDSGGGFHGKEKPVAA